MKNFTITGQSGTSLHKALTAGLCMRYEELKKLSAAGGIDWDKAWYRVEANEILKALFEINSVAYYKLLELEGHYRTWAA
jgi:hypothetical protein